MEVRDIIPLAWAIQALAKIKLEMETNSSKVDEDDSIFYLIQEGYANSLEKIGEIYDNIRSENKVTNLPSSEEIIESVYNNTETLFPEVLTTPPPEQKG